MAAKKMTDKDKAWLKANAGKHTPLEASKILGHPRGTLWYWAMRMGITFKRAPRRARDASQKRLPPRVDDSALSGFLAGR